jgi:hypothetical protein
MLYQILDRLFPRYRSHVEHQVRASLSIADAVREQLKGIQVDLAYLDDLPTQERDELLVKAHDLHTNPALTRISTHLKNDQILLGLSQNRSRRLFVS